MNHRALAAFAASLGLLGLLCARPARADQRPELRCELSYSVKGWSAIYKTGKGTGTVSCSNGQSARVDIAVKGGGLTFGKSEIVDGKGTFSGVKELGEVFGGYGSAGAHAGAVDSAGAEVMTKGNVSLALAGTGHGVDLGVDFGRFEIRPAP